jgi:hypothetical protein
MFGLNENQSTDYPLGHMIAILGLGYDEIVKEMEDRSESDSCMLTPTSLCAYPVPEEEDAKSFL